MTDYRVPWIWWAHSGGLIFASKKKQSNISSKERKLGQCLAGKGDLAQDSEVGDVKTPVERAAVGLTHLKQERDRWRQEGPRNRV